MLIIALSVYQMLPARNRAVPPRLAAGSKKKCCRKYQKSRACRRCPLAGQCAG